MTFVGKKLWFQYESGLQVEGHYLSATEVAWAALTGPLKGASGREAIHAVEAAPGVWFISWLEKTGVTVSQVINLKKRSVAAFVTLPDTGGRRATLHEGTFVEAPA